VTHPVLGPDVEAWSCPDCPRTYRMPPGWEPAVWLSARRAAQYLHAERHGRPMIADRRRRRDDPQPGDNVGDNAGTPPDGGRVDTPGRGLDPPR
jgi:hypothetical protein